MRALTQTTYGAPEQLTVVKHNPPAIGPNDVLIDIHSAAVTQGDRRIRSGEFPGITFLPGRLAMGLTGPRASIAGTSFCGRIAAVGSDVTRFRVGDRVLGGTMSGAHADQLAMPEDGALALCPERLTDDEACSLAYGEATVVDFLTERVRISAGQQVCIVGASGAVGRAAVQLASARGAHVTAVGNASHEHLVRELGADEYVDYRTHDASEAPNSFDLVFDAIGAWSAHLGRPALRDTGTYVSLIVTGGLLVRMLTNRWRRGPRVITGAALGGAAVMERTAQLASDGVFRPVVAQRFPLEAARDAHRALETRTPGGTIVLQIASPLRTVAAA